MSESRRVQRVEKELREIVSSFVVRAMPTSFLSLARVKVSKDLRLAKVYMSQIGQPKVPKDVLEDLSYYAPEIQREVSKKLHMKYCPKLAFFNDDTLEVTARIDSILSQVDEDSADIAH